MKKLLIQMQQQMTSLEAKIDALIARSAPRPVEVKQGNNFRERILHKTICADCRKECEVPFKPTGGRPVYCKDCFSKRKAAGILIKERPGEKVPVQVAHIDKSKVAEKKKTVTKKKAASKKRKKN